MKKILTLLTILAISTSASYASSFGTTFKNAVKSDIKTAKNAVKTDVKNTKKAVKSDINNAKNAVKTDIANTEKANESAAAAKKAEKIKQIDSKLKELNKELNTVKKQKDITESERALKTSVIERQIRFYNKQKQALQ